MIENALNTFFMFATKVLYRHGGGVVHTTEENGASADTDPHMCHFSSNACVFPRH